MGKRIRVKRTTSGGSSGNTIKNALSIMIILDQPAEADDAFDLVASGGAKDVLRTKDATDLVPGARVLRFVAVKKDGKYKLIHKRSKGTKRPVFLETRFQDLTSSGKKSQTHKYAYVAFASQVPTTLPDRYNTDRKLDRDLIAKSPVLVDLEVEDPKL
jgi:hypothetical protein